ncbi:MAG: putative zinc transporter msc2 [Candelina mexicana]|nr:MAG: putative zinc transporter msc2 [Candelina mexicana]
MDTHLRPSAAAGFPRSNSYGFPSVDGGAVKSRTASTTPIRWTSSTEILSALLIPIPLLLSSFAIPASSNPASQPVLAQPAFAHLTKSVIEEATPPTPTSSTRMLAFQSACLLTSTTLMLLGGYARTRSPAKSLDRRKSGLGVAGDTKKKAARAWGFEGAQRILGRTLSVGLPFYASANLGPIRAGIMMLAAVTGGFTESKVVGKTFTPATVWVGLLPTRRYTVMSFAVVALSDLIGFTADKELITLLIGYTAFGLWTLYVDSPFPKSTSKPSSLTGPTPASAKATSAVPSTPWETPPPVAEPIASSKIQSPLISTTEDVYFTLLTGSMLGVLTFVLMLFSSESLFSFSGHWKWTALVAFAASGSIMYTQPSSLRTTHKIGFASISLLCGSLCFLLPTYNTWAGGFIQLMVPCALYLALQLDTWFPNTTAGQSHHIHHEHDHHAHSHTHTDVPRSRFTSFLLYNAQAWPLLHGILVEKDSRRIFYFMTLNFAFMLVQTFYGIATGSLGLLSDSIHMFFDCLALAVGLCAAVMSKWPPSMRFPYGLGKMDTLAGFANGIFLMLISVEIVTEAIDRLAEGAEIRRLGELLAVSTLGLAVNIVGLTAFGHAHHGHGHDHGHSHASHSHTNEHQHEHPHSHHHTPVSIPSTPSKPNFDSPHAHTKHDHGHDHGHGSENMYGIYLHVLADTMGSVAVVISTVLVHFLKWPGWDPLASVIIAVLIFASAIPLVISSAKTLLLTMPADVEYTLRDTLAGISGLRGVVGYSVPRFWLEDSGTGKEDSHGHGHGHGHDHHDHHDHHQSHEHHDHTEPQPASGQKVLGVVHIIASRISDVEDVRERTAQFLKGRGMDIVVQVEKEGEGRCWCGGGVRSA